MSFQTFVPSEFTIFSFKNWLEQFLYAMRIRIKYPKTALTYLVDTNFDRWQYICSHIDDIEQIGETLDFLVIHLDDILEHSQSCCQFSASKLVFVINLVKLASLKRRTERIENYIEFIQHKHQIIQKAWQNEMEKEQRLKEKIIRMEEKQKKCLYLKRGQKECLGRDVIIQRTEISIAQQNLVKTYTKTQKLAAKMKKYESDIRIHRRILRNLSPII
jgi:hypothetical protein